MLDENSTLVHSMHPRTFRHSHGHSLNDVFQFLHRAAAQQPQRPLNIAAQNLDARSTPDLILIVASAGDVLDQICGLNLDQGDLNAEFSERRNR